MKIIEDFISNNTSEISKLLGENKIKEIKNEIKVKFPNIKRYNNISNEITFFENKIKDYILLINKFKDCFELFPDLKENIINLSKTFETLLFNEEQYQIDFTERKDINSFLNVFSNMYAFIIYLLEQIKDLQNIFPKENLLEKYYYLELAKILFQIFEKKSDEEQELTNYFEEEKEKTILLFENKLKEIKESYPENYEKLNKKQKEIYKKKIEEEIEKFENALKNMKTINLKEIGDRLKNYFDYDMYSYADTKFDVILFLYQNKYI